MPLIDRLAGEYFSLPQRARRSNHPPSRRPARADRFHRHRGPPSYVHVEVRKAGVLLRVAGIGTTLTPDEDHNAAMVEIIDEYSLLDDAITQARAALPPLIAALAA